MRNRQPAALPGGGTPAERSDLAFRNVLTAKGRDPQHDEEEKQQRAKRKREKNRTQAEGVSGISLPRPDFRPALYRLLNHLTRQRVIVRIGQ